MNISTDINLSDADNGTSTEITVDISETNDAGIEYTFSSTSGVPAGLTVENAPALVLWILMNSPLR